MSRRTRTTAIILVLLLALVVVAPGLPFVRDAIVTRVVDLLSDNGIDVAYRSTSGNAWRSVTLHDVEAQGEGADVRLERLTVGYFLPSLLGGELPIDVLVHGATGDVDVKRLLDISMGDVDGGGAAGPISLRLRKVDLQDIGVALAQVPFTLPDANIGSLSVTQDGTALDIGATITTADGQATVEGRYDALTTAFTGTVVEADAAIARHWWDGVTAGTVTGTLAIKGGAIDGDFVVTGGAVADLGLNVADVSGTVTMRYPVITAAMNGAAFGGDIAATGVVNISAERWEASGGGTADLGQAADWLVRSLLPDGLPLPLTGTVDVDLNVVGWDEIDLEGRATGSGMLADMPVEELLATFAVTEDGDLSVAAGATLGGGPVELDIFEDARGSRVVATAADVALTIDGNDLGVLGATLDMAADGPADGTLLAAWRADLAGRQVDAQVDARLDPDGWQAFITGSDDLGSSAEGALVLADGRAQGSVTAATIAGLPLSPGARVSVAAAGPIATPVITVTLAGDEPVTLALGPPELVLIDDLRGSVTGTISGTGIPNLAGALGPVGVSGAVETSPLAATIGLTLTETEVAYAAAVSAPVSIPDSVLRMTAEGISWSGTVDAPRVTAGPVVTTPGALSADASFSAGQPWSVTLAGADGSVVASLDSGGFTLELDELPVTGTSADMPVNALVSGTVTPAVTGAEDAAAVDAAPAGVPDGSAAGLELLTVDLAVASGATFGPARLADALSLRGSVNLADSSTRLTGATGELGIALAAAWSQGANLTVDLTSGTAEPLHLAFAADTGRFSLTGDAAPGPLLSALGLAPAGSFSASATADLSGTLATSTAGTGLADLAGDVVVDLTEPLALGARLVGRGSNLDVAVSGGTASLPLSATGTFDLADLSDLTAALGASDAPGSATGLDVTLGPLTGIVVTAAGATGSGTYLVDDLGPLSIDPIDWELTADWTDVEAPFATLRTRSPAPSAAAGAAAAAGDQNDNTGITITLDGGQLWLEGSAALPADYAGESLLLRAASAGEGGRTALDDVAAIPLTGTLASAATGATLLTFDGTVGELLVDGELPTALLAAPLPEQARVAGDLNLDATVNLLAGPSYTAALRLSAAGATLTGDVSGTGSDLRAELTGEDLRVTFDGETLLVNADEASLAPFLASAGATPSLAGTLDGTIAREATGAWRGALVASLTLPLTEPTATDAAAAAAGPATEAAPTADALMATATLQGRGDTLELTASGTGPLDSRFSVTGTLAPTVALGAGVTALDDALTAVLDYAASGLTGVLTTTPFTVEGYAQVPAQRADVAWQPGAPLRLAGPGIDVTAELTGDARLRGTLALPFTLLGAPARLDAVLGGSPTDPSADLELVGSGLRAVGTGDLHGAEAALTLAEPAISGLLPDTAAQFAGAIMAPVTAAARWTPDGGWTLTATGQVGAGGAVADDPAAAAGGLPTGDVTLDLALSGSGASYSGGLGVSLAGHEVALIDIAGVGGDLAADLDLAAVQWDAVARRFGVDVDVVGGGHARLTTAPLDAELDVDMAATANGLAFTLRGSAPNDLDFTVTGELTAEGSGARAVDLSGRLAWDQEQKAVVRGTVGDQRVDASLTLDDALTSGRLLVDVPGARVTADLTTPGGVAGGAEVRRDVAVAATLDGSAFGGLTGDLSAALTSQGGVTTLDVLTAAADVLPGLGDAVPLTLTARGVLAPHTAVTGTITAPTLGETAELRVTGPDGDGAAGTTIALAWGELLAAFDLASTTLHLTGSARLDDVVAQFVPGSFEGLTAEIAAADLSWSPRAGFSGELTATADAPALAGTGLKRPLVLEASARPPAAGVPAELGVKLAVITAGDDRLAVAELTVPADPFGATDLEGAVAIDADVASLLALPGLDLRLAGTADIGGTLTAPTVAGALELAGDVTATGDFGYAAGAAELRLRGPELDIAVASEGSGWSAAATVDRLPLGAWLTQVADPHVSLTARADSTGDTRVTVEDLVIESANSRLTGAASVDTGLRAVLQAQVDLSDLRLAGAPLHGLVRGPVIVTAPTLDSLATANVTAQVDAAGVGIGSVDASVSGSMQLGGSLADPVINAVLRGNGRLSGGLRLDAAPGRGRVQVHSDLAYGELRTDLDLSIGADAVSARGQLRFGEAVLFLSDAADSVSLTGAGRLDGWTVELAPGLAGATVTGPLERLAPGSSGAVDLAVGTGAGPTAQRAAGEPWLRGSVAGLVVAGQELGDLSLRSEEPGAPIDLQGAAVQATFAPSSSAWTLAVADRELPGGLLVDLQGAGTGLTGTLAGTARGTGSVPIDLALEVSVGDAADEGASVVVEGQALGGTLSVTGRRDSLDSGLWTGSVSLTDANYGGIDVAATGSLYGNELVPQVLLNTSATSAADAAGSEPAVSASGLISAGPSGITVDQQVAVAALGDSLRIRGRVSAPTDLVVSAGDGSGWRLVGGGVNLRASGELALDLGPARLTLGAAPASAIPTATLALTSTPALAAGTELAGGDLVAVLGTVVRDGLVFGGTGLTRGSIVVALSPAPHAELRSFGVEVAGFDVEASGTVAADATDLTGTLALPSEVPAVVEGGQVSLPWHLTGDGTTWRFDSTGNLGVIRAAIDLETLATQVDVDVALPTAARDAAAPVERGITSGSVVGRLSYDPATGATGSFAIADVELAPAGVGLVSVNADVAIAGGLVSGSAGIDTSGGRVTLTGSAALAELVPGLDLAGFEDTSGSNLELRVRTLDLGLIPGIANTIPHLDGAVTGVVQLRNGVILGQLVAPEMSVGDRLLPTSLQLSGVPTSIDAALIVGGTLISGDLDAGRLTGSARLERFPLELMAEAFVGPSDVTASLTGVLRFDVPLDDAASGFVRIATEEVRLERAGVVTLGNVTITYDDTAVTVDRVEFGGRGNWRASGVLSPALLDFRLEAHDADFSPLLGLFPDLARYGVGAAGSFTFSADGSFAAPQMSLESDALDITVAGTRYRIEGTSATLDGVDLEAATTVRGLDPLVGALDFSGEATVMLEPLALRYVDFGFAGSLSMPGFGVIEEISGAIRQDANNNPTIELSGMLGAPLTVAGTLVPLDVRAGGTDLDLSLPALLIGDSDVSLDLRLRSEEGGLVLGGAVMADEIILDLGARAAEPAPDELDAAASALTSSELVAATEAQGARNAMAALRFDDLRVTAPQRVVLAMNIANIEAALDLTVSGTAADPRLDGTAEALRGSLRFSGREFTLDSAVANFSASRGVFPDLAIVATTEFEKSRVLTGAQDVRFVSPSEGQTFTVGLAITGPVEAAPPEEGGFRFDVRPVLTSDALIEVDGEGVGTGVRSLTEPELLSLVTLGRVDFQAGLIGAGGLGGAVAQGALDTAVDLLIVGELQNALREALGLDVVEIRTSALSSLFDGDAEQFGVSVRLGGYLNPELFASYRIGTADPGDPGFALTNEVALSYGLGPLDLDLVGRVDFPTAGTLASPRPELGVGLRYDFGRTLGLDAGVTLSTQRSVVSFGVALRW